MENNHINDEQLWKLAHKRAKFKKQAVSYLVINAMLTAIWLVTSFQTGEFEHFWPIWCMIGWGIGLAFSFVDAYYSKSFFNADLEYEKLKKEQSLQQ